MQPANQQIRGLIARLLKEHIKPYSGLFALACIFMVLAALATAALPYLLQPVFDKVFSAAGQGLLLFFCGAVFLSFVVKGLASYGESVVMTYIGQKIISDIQKRLFKHLLQCDLAFFHQTTSGELLSRFTNDVNLMRAAISNVVAGIGKDLFTLLFLISLMFYRDALLAAIAFIIFPTIVAPIAKIGRKMRKVTGQTQEIVGTFSADLTQLFQGMRIVKSYCMEDFENNRISSKIDNIFKLIYKTARVRAASHPVVETLGGLAIVVVIAYGGWQVMHQNRTTGEFISFIGAMLLIYEPLKRLSNLNSNLQEGLACAARVFDVIDTPFKIYTPPAAVSQHIKGEVEFNDVSFGYKSGVLHNLSFKATKGQTVAFVGSSGAGKSTIINLIPRFYDINQGAILVDGVDVKSYNLNNLRSQIALVSQEVALFNLSVAENIAYGTPNASIDAIKAAANFAACDFIEHLANGYDTIVGENGVTLSGGQRQRIAIARAVLKNAPILLLDEATSALDTESEKIVQTHLKKLMHGRTTIVVAHRLSTIIDADVIFVLDNGQIKEQGTHNELLHKNGIYANLWRAQA